MMGYLQAQDGFLGINWGGGSGVTDTVQPKRPPWALDFSKKRNAQKNEMISKFGYIKNPDGSIMRFENGRTLPVTSYINGWALLSYWEKAGRAMMEQAKGRTEAYARLLDVVGRFDRRANEWRSKWAVKQIFASDPRMADELWDQLLSTYVIELDNAIWSGFNIETALSRLTWAVSEAAVEAGKAVAKPMLDVLDAGDMLWKVTKWATIGSVVLLAGWGVSKIMKKRKP